MLMKTVTFLMLISLFLIPAVTAKAEGRSLVLATADTPPFSTPDNNGIYDRLVLEAFRQIGVGVRVEHFPSGRSLAMAVNGTVDGEYGRISGMEAEFPSLVMVDEKLADHSFSAFSLDPELRIDGWDDLKDYHVGYINGWQIMEENVVSAKSVTKVADVKALFSVLLAGRVDVVLYSKRRGEYYLSEHALRTVHVLEPPLAERGMYLYLNRRHEELAQPLAEALRRIK